MHPTIVLIGPMAAGKSTLGGLLAARLGMPSCAMDDVRFAYYAEIGYQQDEATRLNHAGGWEALYRYWKPFEVYALERVIADYPGYVIDLGAGHSVYDQPEQQVRAAAALARCDHVVLLLPSPDPAESVRVIKERIGFTPSGKPFDDGFADYLVRHPGNPAVATLTVYTSGKTPDDCCEEIARRCGLA